MVLFKKVVSAIILLGEQNLPKIPISTVTPVSIEVIAHDPLPGQILGKPLISR